jgi:hypothetical protein
MAFKGNRFALFAKSDDKNTPQQPLPQQTNVSSVDQDDANEAPWQHVKRKGSTQKQNPPAIRVDTKPEPSYTNYRDARKASTSMQGFAESTNSSFENWCGICQRKFPSKTILIAHTKALPNHNNYCNLCKRVFKDRNGLKNHVDNSQGHDVFCNLCLSAFVNEWGLRNHFENNYNVGHEWICMTCLLGFHTEVELHQHLKKGDKHVWCDTCQRRFRTQEERDTHWKLTKSQSDRLNTSFPTHRI